MLDIVWQDGGREPTQRPNPKYPAGRDVDISEGRLPNCTAALPYPAKRCGVYFVICDECGLRVGVTTAGRPDDPRSVTVPCKKPPETLPPEPSKPPIGRLL
jgi:hypothetical protein